MRVIPEGRLTAESRQRGLREKKPREPGAARTFAHVSIDDIKAGMAGVMAAASLRSAAPPQYGRDSRGPPSDRRPAHSLRLATQPMRGAAGRLQLLRVNLRRIKRTNAAVASPSANLDTARVARAARLVLVRLSRRDPVVLLLRDRGDTGARVNYGIRISTLQRQSAQNVEFCQLAELW